MARNRPVMFPLPETPDVDMGEPGWAFVQGILETSYIKLVRVADHADKNANQFLCCGNPECRAPIRLRAGEIPKVCYRCGSECDWKGIETKTIKVCPECNHRGMPDESFCDSHIPAISLTFKEILV